mmetsp:Transcript_23394/g.46577  ORF Transcript_23394/g.46577 Transcript_23394/m.46577 type:complete len:425 (-) Transcript_23394:35-1309(-)
MYNLLTRRFGARPKLTCFLSTSTRPPPTTSTPPSPGLFQNPIVEHLWSTRHASSPSHEAYSEAVPRPPSLSSSSVLYPFSSDPVLRETYKSPWGEVRLGKVLEDLDAAAGNVAYSHCVKGGAWPTPLLVTAGVDSIQLLDGSRADVERDMVLTGAVQWVGSSSLSLTMSCRSEGSVKPWLTAKFTFVARDAETGRATKIVELLPETEEEKEQFEVGRLAAERKKEVRKASKVQSAYTLEMEKMAHDMLAKAAPLSKMPALAPPNLLLMSRTELHNAFVAQPQQRNMANRIFGGFLMRRAFELAFATAYSFGGVRPKFVEVDDISFLEPVDVGDLLVFHARVLYTLPDGGELRLDGDNPLAIIEVEAWVQDPVAVTSEVSNRLYFTFSLPGKKSCREVVPENLAEAKRAAQRMLADLEQVGAKKI